MSIAIARPLALLLVAVVPLYFLLRKRAASPMPLPRAAKIGEPRLGVRSIALLPDAARTFALVALVLAIAGPSSAGAVIEEQREGVPIVLAIDISSSMLARDFQPRDRLEVAKSTISRFVEAREGDPIGIVAFAGEALTLVPVTTHRGALIGALQSLQVGLLEDGTAIGDGLAAAINRLRGLERREAVVVLLSDGESNRGILDPLATADAAAALGIRVHTIGVGSEGTAPVPVRAEQTGIEYVEMTVGLDEDLLRAIASRTGGTFFRATDPLALDRIYEEIDRIVPSVVETIRHTQRVPWAPPLLLAAIGFLVGEWLLRGSRWGALP